MRQRKTRSDQHFGLTSPQQEEHDGQASSGTCSGGLRASSSSMRNRITVCRSWKFSLASSAANWDVALRSRSVIDLPFKFSNTVAQFTNFVDKGDAELLVLKRIGSPEGVITDKLGQPEVVNLFGYCPEISERLFIRRQPRWYRTFPYFCKIL